MTTTETLQAALAEIRSKGLWKSGLDNGGVCTFTALCRPGPGPSYERSAALAALKREVGVRTSDGIYRWNDRPERTQAEVEAVYERAIAATA
jgi:hypothetical protein